MPSVAVPAKKKGSRDKINRSGEQVDLLSGSGRESKRKDSMVHARHTIGEKLHLKLKDFVQMRAVAESNKTTLRNEVMSP